MRSIKDITDEIYDWIDKNNGIRRNAMLHHPELINEIINCIETEIEERTKMNVTYLTYNQPSYLNSSKIREIKFSFKILLNDSHYASMVFEIEIIVNPTNLKIIIDLEDELFEKYKAYNDIVCSIFNTYFFELCDIGENDINNFYEYSKKHMNYGYIFHLKYLENGFDYENIFNLLEELKNIDNGGK